MPLPIVSHIERRKNSDLQWFDLTRETAEIRAAHANTYGRLDDQAKNGAILSRSQFTLDGDLTRVTRWKFRNLAQLENFVFSASSNEFYKINVRLTEYYAALNGADFVEAALDSAAQNKLRIAAEKRLADDVARWSARNGEALRDFEQKIVDPSQFKLEEYMPKTPWVIHWAVGVVDD